MGRDWQAQCSTNSLYSEAENKSDLLPLESIQGELQRERTQGNVKCVLIKLALQFIVKPVLC